MKTPKALRARFPYQFEGKNIGISTPRGWFASFSQLCADIDDLLGQNKRGFHWVQVKEKFGACRAYWSLDKDDGAIHVDIFGPDGLSSFVNDPSSKHRDGEKVALMKSITALVKDVMDKTIHTCAVCGAPGALDQTHGYLLVLCPAHTQQRKKDSSSMESLWFECEEWV
jgi:hypothetical protein